MFASCGVVNASASTRLELSALLGLNADNRQLLMLIVGRFNADRIQLRRNRVHRSLFNREDELNYLRQLSVSLFPYILPENVQICR